VKLYLLLRKLLQSEITFLAFIHLDAVSGLDLLPIDVLRSKLIPRRVFSWVLNLTPLGTFFGMMLIRSESRLPLMFALMKE